MAFAPQSSVATTSWKGGRLRAVGTSLVLRLPYICGTLLAILVSLRMVQLLAVLPAGFGLQQSAAMVLGTVSAAEPAAETRVESAPLSDVLFAPPVQAGRLDRAD